MGAVPNNAMVVLMKKKVRKTIGVYMVYHARSNSAYVGGSIYIENRFSYHKAILPQGTHYCKNLQELWSRTESWEWEFKTVEVCPEDILRIREQHWMDSFTGTLLNSNPNAESCKGHKHSKETKAHMSEVMSKFYSSEPAREWLSNKASEQHKSGNFGRATWSEEAKESQRLKMIGRGKGVKRSDETRQKQRKAWTPERRAAQAERIRALTAKRYEEFRRSLGLK